MAPPAVPNTLLKYGFLKRKRCIDELAPLSETDTVKEPANSSLLTPHLVEPSSYQATAEKTSSDIATFIPQSTRQHATVDLQSVKETHCAAKSARMAVLNGKVVRSAVLSPDQMLERFRHRISKSEAPLSEATGEFLSRLNDPLRFDPQHMTSIRDLVQRFKDTEPRTANCCVSELSTFSGDTRNPIGMILHYPTFRKSTEELLDMGNSTILPLMEKGINRNNVFAFDWHWRRYKAESDGGCPLLKTTEGVQNLHNKLSTAVLQIAPMPLLIVFGKCARRSYVAASGKLRKFTVPLRDGSAKLYGEISDDVLITALPADVPHLSRDARAFKALTIEQWAAPESLDLHYEYAANGSVKRLVFFAMHPSALYNRFSYRTRYHAAISMDCAINLFFGLAGVPHGNRNIIEYFRRLDRETIKADSALGGIPQLDEDALCAIREADQERSELASGSIPTSIPQGFWGTARQLLAEEVKGGIVMGYNELPISFRRTIKLFHSIDPVALEQSGLSILNAIVHCLSGRSSAKTIAAKDKRSETPPYLRQDFPINLRSGQKVRDWWHGQEVLLSAKGEVVLWYREGAQYERITFWGKGSGTHRNASKDPLFIYFKSDGIQLRGPKGAAAKAPIRWTKSLDEFRKLKDGSARLLRAHARELQHQKEVILEGAAKVYGKENVDPHSTM